MHHQRQQLPLWDRHSIRRRRRWQGTRRGNGRGVARDGKRWQALGARERWYLGRRHGTRAWPPIVPNARGRGWLHDAARLQLVQHVGQRRLERAIDRRRRQAAANFILANDAELPGCQVDKAVERGVQMPLDMIEMAIAKIEMNQAETLGIAQHQARRPPARARRRDECREPSQWMPMFHLATSQRTWTAGSANNAPAYSCAASGSAPWKTDPSRQSAGYACARGAPHLAQYISPAAIGCP